MLICFGNMDLVKKNSNNYFTVSQILTFTNRRTRIAEKKYAKFQSAGSK